MSIEMHADSAEEPNLPGRLLLLAVGAIALSTALHVVPQLLRDSVDPAWSMLVLMTLDACVVALIVRSRTALLVGILLAVLLGITVLSHQQLLAALPSIALNLMLAGVFAVTLRRGETPLIVQIAELDGPVAPNFGRYLQRLTLAWAIFFAAMAALSLLLMLYAPFEWWSLFVNVLTWPLIAAMFVVEWPLRVVCFRKLPRHTPLYIATRIFAYQRQLAQMRAGSRAG
ncbi:MAG TPA: hypothetical protein VJU53_08010 [Burkholderiaceae bacterium]|nr:hypothetical protein [Burkholderiaceae bacterium]